MSVYYIAEHIITDPVKFEEYRVKVAPMIAAMAAAILPGPTAINFRKARTGGRSGSSLSNFQTWSASTPGTHPPRISR